MVGGFGHNLTPVFILPRCLLFRNLQNDLHSVSNKSIFSLYEDYIFMDGIEDNKLTVKDLYKEFWECRNFEIDYLRLRSIFLAVFLLAIAAGYGIFVNDHLKEIPPSQIGRASCRERV